MNTSRLAHRANSGGAPLADRFVTPTALARNRLPGGFGRIFLTVFWLVATSLGSIATLSAAIAPPLGLSWDANSEPDIASYELSYGTSSGIYTTVLNVGNATSATISGLIEGQTYYFVVVACSSSGLKSAPSAEVAETLAVTPRIFLPTSGWTLKYSDSQETPDFSASMAFDGNPATFWHTSWSTTGTALPHEIQIDLGSPHTLTGFSYLPRQDNYAVGNIGQYEFYTSTDGTTWGAPVATGTFANTSDLKEIFFTPKIARFIRLKSLTSSNSDVHTSIAELRVFIPQSEVAQNQAPSATPKSITTNEDSATPIILTGIDPENSTLAYTVVTSPTKGILSGTPPNLTYTPTSNLTGPDSFTFKVSDGSLDSGPATVSISISPVNDAPAAKASSFTTIEDTATSIILTGTDPENSTLSYTVVTSPTKGTLSGTPPNLTYTPTSNLTGLDSFTFKVSDGSLDSPPATVSISITPVNDVPLAASKSITTPESTPAAVVLSGSDPETRSSLLTFSIVTPPAHGALTGTAPKLTYTPASGFSGADQFTYVANDGTANSVPATVSITVTKVTPTTGVTLIPRTGWTLKYADSEEAPDYSATAAFDGNTATFWHTKWKTGTLPPPPHEIQINLGSSQTINGFRYLPRQDGPTVGNIARYEFYVSTDGTNWGTPAATGTLPASTSEREIIFTPKTGQFIRLRELSETNGGSECNIAELGLLTGNVTNNPPAATSQNLTTDEDASLTLTLTGTDPENAALSFTIVTPPAHGQLTGTAPHLTYVPDSDFNGPDSFTFLSNDGTADSPLATISITVTPVDEVAGNVPPVFDSNPIRISATEDQPLSGHLIATDENPADTLTYTKISGPTWLTLSASGELGGTPLNGNIGENTFTVKATDPSNASATGTLIVTVYNTNDAPAFKSSTLVFPNGSENTAYSGQTLSGSATDSDRGDSITYSKVSGPAWLTISSTGTLSGTPPAGSRGLALFRIRATDADRATAEATLQIQILENSLPLPWNVNRLGRNNLTGGARYSAGSFTVTGAGQFANTQDAANFGWQRISGDGKITARVRKIDKATPSALVGIMIRESLATNSRQVFIGTGKDKDYHWLRRGKTGATTARKVVNNPKPGSIWLRLVRDGDTITASRSSDGIEWTSVGKTHIQLPKNCYIGLSVSSGDDENLATSTFSNVNVTP